MAVMACFDHEFSINFQTDSGKNSIKCEDGNGFNVKWEKEGENVYVFEIFDKVPEYLRVDVISRRPEIILEMLDVNKYKIKLDDEFKKYSPDILFKTKFNFKKIEIAEDQHPLAQTIKIPAILKSLKLGEFFEKSITLCDGIEIAYRISFVIGKYGESEYQIKIKSKTHDFDYFGSSLNYVEGNDVFIVFCPNKFPQIDNNEQQQPQRESVLTLSKYDYNSRHSRFYRNATFVYVKERIPSNIFQEKVDNYGEKTDVKITSNDGKIIKVHKKVLECKSEIFKALFKNRENEIPFELDLNYNSEIISGAMAYFYEVIEGIDGHEIELIKFAQEYGIPELKKQSAKFLEKKITKENTFDIFKIAFDYDLEALKKKAIYSYKIHTHSIDKKPLKDFTKEMLLEFF